MQSDPNADVLIPPYVLALFEGDEGGGEGGDGGDGGDAGAASTETGKGAAKGGSSSGSSSGTSTARDTSGRFASIADAERRIAELAESDKNRRLENKELKASLATLQSQATRADQRAIRGEVRAALNEAGAIDSDVVDLLIKYAGAKITVDKDTGEVVGVAEAIADYKAKKPAFFKAAEQKTEGEAEGKSGDGKSGDGKAKDGAESGDGKGGKQNATGSGASTAGNSGGSGNGTRGGMPDLRSLNSPAERKAAIADYKRSLKRGLR